MALYTPDYALQGAAADLHKQQFMDNHWRQQTAQGANNVLAQRQQASALMPQQYVAAGQPGSQYQLQDDLRSQAFRAARMGTTAGSADIDRKTQAKGAHGARLAGMFAQGQEAERGQNLSDQQQMLAWLQQIYGQGGAEQLGYQSSLAASGARSGQTRELGNIALQEDANTMAYNALRSQILGGQLGTAGSQLNTAGQLGVGPAWAQALGQRMTASRGQG